ncbi:SMI1/KNR4 family protein [Pedobacter boryungensis]|uniref:SMI1/KNR4 family protein n=1 Tax=Pedobacter boryungensis TaxID=869962 RepID=A0ABX2DEC0_9SPHI|nr:SMI1/KNR4 family protein [Pedobacter boryungensis]NQX32448.1 SMI1/KNR4 family protein [Pedobacter boryungensis]
MKIFEEILNKYNFPKRTEKPSTTIAQIESVVKFNLPTDYKTYIQNYSGFETYIGEAFVRLWDLDELLATNKDYEIFDNLPNTLAIGGNGSSEFIAIELINISDYRIVLSPFIDLDKQYHIEIGTSFSDFLLRLDKGQEWFK